MSDYQVHFFNDVRLSGRKTNVFTRKEMIRAFANLEELDKVIVHCVVSSSKEKNQLVKELETDKISLKPVYLPGFSDRLSEKSIVGRMYKVLVLNRLLDFIYFWRLLKGFRYSTNYIWGLQPTIATILSGYVSQNSFILEFDDYMFENDVLKDFIYLKAASSALKVSTVSQQTKKDLVEKNIDPDKIEVLPNAVNPGEFSIDKKEEEIRAELAMPTEKFIVTYTGHLYDWKGVETLIEARRHFQSEEVKILIIGGNQENIEKYRKMVNDRDLEETISIIGYVSRKKIPMYQKASDVLVVPNSSETEKSVMYTSPVKLKEYMMSGTPVIASKLPSIQELSSDKEIFYFEPDNSGDLVSKINKIRENPGLAAEKSEKARKAITYTWKDRAKKLFEDVF